MILKPSPTVSPPSTTTGSRVERGAILGRIADLFDGELLSEIRGLHKQRVCDSRRIAL